MVVDLGRREETETDTIRILFCVISGVAVTEVVITEIARELHHVCIALEVRYANAEVVELICELSSKAVNKCTIRC